MNRSLLHRLPDIVALARQRARELPDPVGRRGGSFGRLDPPDQAGLGRVSLLCGDELSVLLGLRAGLGREGPLAGRLPLIGLNEDPHEPADTQGTVLTPRQHETRRLIELATRLFLARELLGSQGVLILTARDAPDRGIERLLDAVFGRTHRLRTRPAPGWQCFLTSSADWPASLSDTVLHGLEPGPSLLGELTRQLTGAGDPVLVLRAQVRCTDWVGVLDRRWIFVQPDPMSLALLREHVIARQMAAGAALRTEEPGYGWEAMS